MIKYTKQSKKDYSQMQLNQNKGEILINKTMRK